MRDFVPSNYNNLLWINDILSLKTTNSNKEYVALAKKSGRKYSLAIKFVSIYGLVVDVKHIPNKGYLYTVDDGTGVILCNHNTEQFVEVIQTAEKESDALFNSSFRFNETTRSFNESTRIDDTIFSDQTHSKDQSVIRMKSGLQSLYADIIHSYQNLVNSFNIGDLVYVHGKLYTYFDSNQIYVNSIRKMSVMEEIMHNKIKLEDGFDPLVPVAAEPEPATEENVQRNPKRKFSGIITFDHIPSTEMKVPPTKYQTPEKSIGEESLILKKRKSIVSPYLDGIMTFDTNYNNNDSMEMDEL